MHPKDAREKVSRWSVDHEFSLFFNALNKNFALHPRAAVPPGAAGLLVAVACLLAACGPGRAPSPPAASDEVLGILEWPSPSADERYCAWYGSERDGVLYFGQAAFWSAMRDHDGDPRGDLQAPGPQHIGRVDLARRVVEAPLDVSEPGARSGVWDVLAHDAGVFYTTFYETAGRVNPATGEVIHFDGLGKGLNELAHGPDGAILVSRYGGADGGDGSVLLLEPDGRVRAEHRLDPTPGHVVAPKSVAFDPVRREIWVNADLLPQGDGKVRYDARILDLQGREQLRVETPEIQFVAFRPDGWGVTAEVDDRGLWLRILRPTDSDPMPERGQRLLLDPHFDRGHDFAQDVQFESGGERVIVMRWSGRYHLLDLARERGTSDVLPRADGGIFYTGAVHGDVLCATLCGDVKVVCARPPSL